MRRPHRRADAKLSLVRCQACQIRRAYLFSQKMPPLRPGHEEGLAVLRLVLRPRSRFRRFKRLFRCSLCRPLQQQELRPPGPDAIHALLPLVQDQGQASLEDAGYRPQMHSVQLGDSQGLLDTLSVVREAPEALGPSRAHFNIASDFLVTIGVISFRASCPVM